MNKAFKEWIEAANVWMTLLLVVILVVFWAALGLFVLITVFCTWVLMLIITLPVFLWELIKQR